MNIRLGRREIKKDRLDGQRSCNFGRESRAGRLGDSSIACVRFTEFGLSLAEAKAITDTTDGKPPLFPPVGDAKQLTAVLASELGYCGCALGQLSRFSEHCFRPFRSELTRPAMELRLLASRRLEALLETGGGWAEWLVYGLRSSGTSCSTGSDSPTCSSRRGVPFASGCAALRPRRQICAKIIRRPCPGGHVDITCTIAPQAHPAGRFARPPYSVTGAGNRRARGLTSNGRRGKMFLLRGWDGYRRAGA